MRAEERTEGRDRACPPQAVGENERIRYRAAAEQCAEAHRNTAHAQAVRRAGLDLEGQRQQAPHGVGLAVAGDPNELSRDGLKRCEHGVTHARRCTCHDAHTGAVERRAQEAGAIDVRERGVTGGPGNVKIGHGRPALERLHLKPQ